jgi:hypothetical protein
MENTILNITIVILFSIMMGMILALVIIPEYKYHGPNSRNIINKIYKNKGKCYNFNIKPLDCPKKLF